MGSPLEKSHPGRCAALGGSIAAPETGAGDTISDLMNHSRERAGETGPHGGGPESRLCHQAHGRGNIREGPGHPVHGEKPS